MKLLLILAFVATAAAARSAEFENFKAQFGRKYENGQEEDNRRVIFEENLKTIKDHNNQFDAGKVSFTLGVNQFADMTREEFSQQMNGLKPRPENYKPEHVFEMPAGKVAPASLDWRDKGYVTPIKDQGQCGSCYSFSATGALEGQNFAKTGVLVSLSEQNIMDCSWLNGNVGCNGGLPDNCFKYVIHNKGIDTEASYPYEEKSKLDNCRYNVATKGGSATEIVDIKKSESDLLNAVTTVGPVSVGIDASHQSFQLYSSGVYYEPRCSTTELDHAVLTVGYGTDAGTDYWLVKNSWGVKWGIQGYIEMSRNKNNNCGIASQASYPRV